MKKGKKIALSILLVIVTIIGSGSIFVYSRLNRLKHVDLPTSKEELGINEGVTENPHVNQLKNILLLGVDSRSDSYDDTRSDVIIILTIDEKNKTIKLSSIMRDSYLYDTVRNKFDKVNHAYAFGGPLESIKTLNSNLDLNIDDFLVVNFGVVAQLVNSLGGISMDLNDEEVKNLNPYYSNSFVDNNNTPIIKPGIYLLNGEQAVSYSRIRHATGGDQKRTERQRIVIEKLINKSMNSSWFKLVQVLDQLLPHVSTSLTYSEILDLGKTNYDMKVTNVEQYMFPSSGKGKMLNGIYYQIPTTLEDNVKELHSFIYGTTEYIPSARVQEYTNKIISISGYKN